MLNTEFKRTVFAFFFYFLCFLGSMYFVFPESPWIFGVAFLVVGSLLACLGIYLFVRSLDWFVKTGRFDLGWLEADKG